MIKLLSFFVLTSWALVFSAPVQTKTITGKVTHAVTGKGLASVTVTAKGRAAKTQTDQAGNYKIQVSGDQQALIFNLLGFTACEVKIGKTNVLNVKLRPQSIDLKEVAVNRSIKFTKPVIKKDEAVSTIDSKANYEMAEEVYLMAPAPIAHEPENFNTEEYDAIHETGFLEAA